METIVTKPNMDKNGNIAVSAVIILGVFIGMFCFDVIEPSRIRLINLDKSKTIQNHEPDLCEEFGYLSIEPSGRLGNFISQYATLYGFAKFYGIPPVIHPYMRDRLRHMFKHTSVPVFTNKTCSSPFYCEVEQFRLSANLLKSTDCNFKITGHPR